MIRRNPTTFALLCLARSIRTNKPIYSKISGILGFNFLSSAIFFGSIFRISLLELELRLALEALNQVAHLSDGFVLKSFKFSISQKTSNLVLHHCIATPYFQAFEIPSLVDKLRVDVFVDARHTEDMPAVVDIEEDVPVEIFIVFPVALTTFYDFTLINC